MVIALPSPLLFIGDIIAAGALCVAGMAGIRIAREAPVRRPGHRYWTLAGAGLVYLSVDELLGLHELIANGIGEAGGPLHPPGLNHLNDGVLLLYFAGGAIVSAWYAREILRHRRAAVLMLCAAGILGVGMAVDSFGPKGYVSLLIVEELTEIAGAAVLAIAFRTVLLEESAAVMRPATRTPTPVRMAGEPEAFAG